MNDGFNLAHLKTDSASKMFSFDEVPYLDTSLSDDNWTGHPSNNYRKEAILVVRNAANCG
jgi:hypothetical protein